VRAFVEISLLAAGRKSRRGRDAATSHLLGSLVKQISAEGMQYDATPPMLNADVKSGHIFRFQVNYTSSPVSFSITRAKLLQLLIMNAKSDTTNYRLLASIRLNSVSVYPIASTGGGAGGDAIATNTLMSWLSTNGPDTNLSITSTPLHPRALHSRPPKTSLAKFWSRTGSNESEVLFIFSPANNSIIDLHCTIVLQNQILSADPPVLVTTGASGVAGTIYTVPLDGVAITPQLSPIAYSTLV